MPFQYRRQTGISKKISSINENDVRVRLLGRIIEKSDSSVILDDGSGKTEIIFDTNPQDSVGDLVRIYTRVLPLENGFELHAEFSQSMKKLDIDLYKKVFK